MKLKFFIHRPILSTVISLIIALCGLVALFNLPVAQFPEISPPSIQVSATFPGANAETAAKVVAAQIENQMNGVTGLMYMATSTTAVGTINITLTYKVGTNLNYAINEVLNRLEAAMPLLPQVVQRQGVTARKQSPDMLMAVSFYSDPYINPVWVSDYLSRTLENDILMLPSVGTVALFGPGSFALVAWLDPNKMQKLNVSVNDIQQAIKDQNQDFIIGRSNSAPNESNKSLTINVRGGTMFSTPEELANVVIHNTNNETIRIKDVARVELGSNNYNTVAQVNFVGDDGKFKHYPCTIMQIFLTPSANQLQAREQIAKVIEKSSQHFPAGLQYKITVDNSRFVKASVKNVADTLKIAFILVGIVIFIFLQNWRASLIAIISIPISIVGTLSTLHFSPQFGYRVL